jgi:hypothetical protein
MDHSDNDNIVNNTSETDTSELLYINSDSLASLIIKELYGQNTDYVLIFVPNDIECEKVTKKITAQLQLSECPLLNINTNIKSKRRYQERNSWREEHKEIFSLKIGSSPTLIIIKDRTYFQNLLDSMLITANPKIIAFFGLKSKTLNSLDSSIVNSLKNCTKVYKFDIKRNKSKNYQNNNSDKMDDVTEKISKMFPTPPTFIQKAMNGCKTIFFGFIILLLILTFCDIVLQYSSRGQVHYK